MLERRARAYKGRGKNVYRPGQASKLAHDWTGLRALPYPRVSDDEQQEDGFSLESQEQRAVAEGLAKGATIVVPPRAPECGDATLDVACPHEPRCVPRWDTTTGRFFKFDRENPDDKTSPLKEAKRLRLKWAYENPDKWDVLVSARRDRPHRNVVNTIRHMEWLHANGKHFVSLDGWIDTTTPIGRAAAVMLAAMAEMEPYQFVERALPVKADMLRRGLYAIGLQAPFGLQWSVPGKRRKNRKYGAGELVPDETVDARNGKTEAEILRWLFEQRAVGAAAHPLAVELGWCGCDGRNPPVDPVKSEAFFGTIAPFNTIDKSARVKGSRKMKSGPRSMASRPGRTYRMCPGGAAVLRIVSNPLYMGVLTFQPEKKDGTREVLRFDIAGERAVRMPDGSTRTVRFVPPISGELWRAANRGVEESWHDTRVWVPETTAAWLRAEAERCHAPLSRVICDVVDRHVEAAPYVTRGPRDVEKVKLPLMLKPRHVAALQRRAEGLGRPTWSGVLRGCIAAEMARVGELPATAGISTSSVESREVLT